jgi:pimeloyl-ACP methyl ester carboxylesterase
VGSKLEETCGIVNGLIGDYLDRTDNGLATPMQFVADGQPIAMSRQAFAQLHPEATGRVVVLVHGVMCTENIWRLKDGSDYGTLLGRDLGYTPLYVRYNSGLAIPDNGTSLSALVEALVDLCPTPIDQILLVGFSMGGLVVRSACHAAMVEHHRWLKLVRRAIYIGTPHRGAPAERAGRMVAKLLRSLPDPYSRLIGEIGDLRSEGIKDLGNARLRHQDSSQGDEPVGLCDPRHPVPLLPGIEHHLIAGSMFKDRWTSALFGDAIVPVSSATGGQGSSCEGGLLSRDNVKILSGVAHVGLAHHPAVYEQIRAWCQETQ